ncbi:DUF1203 domain-containing protein [Siculibacillus lacustris]|uniref:DUF1203 domain-containing protein n=1 Tax=Siculibacillus lacustris TaxID=1549641 RepID=A0A4Q9VH34_9HYPH|nr:DUF1203 domain-containing protein [Siculibacillus lacustris]TBW34406.1 DUF1203 domain-containing protein [Siculibacillus lacustris]
MTSRITGLSPEPFRRLWNLPEAELARRDIRRVVARERPGYPDRIEMREAAPGETLLLLNHLYQPAASPYRGSPAIDVREGAEARYDRIGEVPEVMRTRLLSVRAFDAEAMIVDADVVDGRDLEPLIARLFENEATVYLHVHNAERGCCSGRIDRV